jgi:hypothetical protein
MVGGMRRGTARVRAPEASAAPPAVAPDGAAAALKRKPLTSAEGEAAHRAEATSLLIRAGYRVYRPEADVQGEDLVIRTPDGQLRSIQLKGRPTVEWARYGGMGIWMLFPDPIGVVPGRDWFLIAHDVFYAWVERRHGKAAKWGRAWHYPKLGKEVAAFLESYRHPHW